MLPTSLASSALLNPVTVGAVTARSDVVAIFGAVAAILLIGLLVLKELVSAYRAEPHMADRIEADALDSFVRATNSAIVPLSAVFALAVIVKIAEAL